MNSLDTDGRTQSAPVGNYVVQGALRFGAPASDFIFDAMVDRCWEIGSGRFGARSVRQILDSPGISLYHIVSFPTMNPVSCMILMAVLLAETSGDRYYSQLYPSLCFTEWRPAVDLARRVVELTESISFTRNSDGTFARASMYTQARCSCGVQNCESGIGCGGGANRPERIAG